jgi:hypothetical protein
MLYSLGTIKAVNRNDRFTSIRDIESVATTFRLGSIPAV